MSLSTTEQDSTFHGQETLKHWICSTVPRISFLRLEDRGGALKFPFTTILSKIAKGEGLEQSLDWVASYVCVEFNSNKLNFC